ncbi:2-C-methyl-D-erythritol 4-phosphate cytidylyltransferase [Flexibacter flexilis DSM 6793]|uniref:2-C-methyl-D-erythritol 4-phosphate cytidylyltransferase n=1 Tax=Flexibacter flexilis DSM 6793 TaxID=927664 RepID=A0A1I1LD68_9BACT|nr:2-C-methyl-D-erythritol 4-phosphate cytidylyltransferase [Flexibacter flexilis]SFC68958.1 2-C-methyl-D-erythritol 4-phosphate cytidylyltransferase [Flexibacter flexilis DSM 6793]
MNNRYAVIVAGGSGSRMQSQTPKQFIAVRQLPVLMHTLHRFAQHVLPQKIRLVLPAAHFQTWNELCAQYNFSLPVQVVEGGNSRFQSVRNGLKTIENSSSEALVAIHDGVRPLVSGQVIEQCFEQAQIYGNAVASVALKDSIRQILPDGASQAVDRQLFRLVQTPQTFALPLIAAAYDVEETAFFTDDASVAEAYGATIRLVEGNYENIKITTPEDLAIAEAFLN